MKRLAVLVAATLTVVGCAAAEPTMQPAPSASASVSVPDGGRPVQLEYAPTGLSVPADAIVDQEIDQVNNVTLVFAAPTGAELAAYYRAALPRMGFTITADKNNSLLFENEHWKGAFTASGQTCAITFRTDWER